MTEADARYHAHVYYTLANRDTASQLRDRLQRLAGVLYVGKMRDNSIGPHPQPQFEVHFVERDLPRLRDVLRAAGLTVLVHPLTDDDLADHTTLAQWIGDPLPLDLSVLDPPGVNQGIPRFGTRDV